MAYALEDQALDTLFRSARTQNKWTDQPVSDDELRAVHELMKWGPTSANSQPMRLVFCRTPEAKTRLAQYATPGNQAKIKAAPVTAIVAYDLSFYELLPTIFPAPSSQKMLDLFRADVAFAQATAFRNSSLQGAYFIIAARAAGLDCGPMSGFNNGKLDADFFAGTSWRSNFICSLGHGDPAGVMQRLPRLSFDEACRLL